MSATLPVATPVAQTAETQALLTAVNELKSNQETLQKTLSDLTASNDKARNEGPFVRKGEDSMNSRGYMFSRLLGVMFGKAGKESAKHEINIAERLQKEYVERGFYTKGEANSVLVPFSSHHIAQIDPQLDGFAREIGQMVRAGAEGYDKEEVRRLRAQHWGVQKALSWQDEGEGGALVGPPAFGELIELLRNNEVFLRAGARTLPLPANGRVVWPRHTNASTASWLGEAQALTESSQKTGDLVLQAKKLGIFVKVPNELFRYATISIEQFVREDMMKSASLKMDKSFLEAVGSANEPKGLINYAGISNYTASTVGANGNTIEPEDVMKIMATVEEANAEFKAWVMRPLMYAAISNRRADAVVAGDKKGDFLFNMLRDVNTVTADVTREGPGNLSGYPVFKSTQVSKLREKGSATDLSYILGGNFQDYIVAMSGVMEFLTTNTADTPFTTDSTWIRALLFADGAPRHEASFILIDDLIVG